jgi:perosamine synthetase
VKARTFCQKHNLVLIEDCAEAPLSHDKSGLLCGSVGDAATFSFFANKLITCGEGGLISFRDESLLSKAKAIRSHGMSSRGIYEYDYVGSNYRLTNLHASILFGQCERISEILSTRFSLLELYSNYLCGMWTLLPRAIGQSKPSPWFSIVVPKDTNSHLVTMKSGELATAGIQHRRLFLPLHLSKPYLHYPRIVSSTAVVIDGFMLPLHYKLTGAEIQSICDILNYGL